MKWTKPEHGSGRITAAGKIVSGRKEATSEMSWDEAFNIAGNWRSAHGYPLHVLATTLRNRAKKVDAAAIVAQRLKRMPSILAKLKRFNGMQLSQMQDLGGCRAVVASSENVDSLVSLYEQRPCVAVEFKEKYDYIRTPKADGYRGVHFVYRYASKGEQRALYNGLRIEIQIRSIYQHIWATAVETIDTFTKQALKSGVGDDSWKRFFVLVSSFIALMESRPPVPNTPAVPIWFDELENLINRLHVTSTLERIQAGMKSFPNIPAAAVYILVLDLRLGETTVHGFDSEEEAARRYIEIERETIDNSAMQTVMVSVDSVSALRDAYPNYYLDTARFIGVLQGFTRGRQRRRASEEDEQS